MARLILGVTGSVAAIRTPALFRALSAAGHEVRVVATEPALYFFDPAELDACKRRRCTGECSFATSTNGRAHATSAATRAPHRATQMGRHVDRRTA